MSNLYSVTLTLVRYDVAEPGFPPEIAFTARCHDAPDKRWTLASGEAAAALASLFSSKEISYIGDRLCSCESITLPTTYGPAELVQMGYRMLPETSRHQELKAHVPSTSVRTNVRDSRSR
jgi:hypothetical protein